MVYPSSSSAGITLPLDYLDGSNRFSSHRQHLPSSHLSYLAYTPTRVLREDIPTPLQIERRVSTPSPISIPSVMGLIMPNPNAGIYTNTPYIMGYVDPGPPPLVPVAATMRQVTPLLTFPNYTTYVFPGSGSVDVSSKGNTSGEAGWCSISLIPTPSTFSFTFDKPGWHQWVINATYVRPTVTGSDSTTDCSDPPLASVTLFATQAIRVQPSPTNGGTVLPPASAFTLWVGLSNVSPGELPVDKASSGRNTIIIVVLCIVGAVVVVATCGSFFWLLRRKKRAEMEAVAISRMRPEDAAEFVQYQPTTILPQVPQGYPYGAGLMQAYHAPLLPGAQIDPYRHGGYDTRLDPPMGLQGPPGWMGFRRRWLG